ncbi:hypothetical protein VK792_19300 [Mesobacterium sp. TK19101]|uniref:Uncharacterized protein n=1 Tax=Mesobacterium hydrothermale TaxID=3111907 RepID=A0ABU6HLU7_9RHOB|nr:hypothetical protein [Mesobacterium sp. TK19101]MEC3863432.1 hypothetical protein [Mesobacterium sp. TK19101]
MLAPIDETDEPTSPSQKRVRAPLRNIHEVRAELVKVYREARGAKLSIESASKLCFILTQIAKITETTDLAQRIEKLEQGQ